MSCALSQLMRLSLWLLIKNSHYTTAGLADLTLLYIKHLQKWGRKYPLPHTGVVLIMILSFSRWENRERLSDYGRSRIFSVWKRVMVLCAKFGEWKQHYLSIHRSIITAASGCSTLLEMHIPSYIMCHSCFAPVWVIN